MIVRRKTREIRIGKVKVGGGAPVSIQSMVKVATADTAAVIRQIKTLERAGCEIVRVAVKSVADAEAIRAIKRKITIPLVADIHFDHRLALKSIAAGVDKIRINPGNMRRREDILAVARAARGARIPVRIGVNSGSVKVVPGSQLSVPSKRRKDIAAELVDAALKSIKVFEAADFRDIIVSLKASDVVSTVDAYRRLGALCGYPFHVGITAAGPYDSGIVKSAIGIGALLLDGIGDTIRVSLTADPVEEVFAAKRILSALGMRRSGPEIISCPVCGRCQVNLGNVVRKLESKLKAQSSKLKGKENIKIAVMGCEVNGPGEAREADIGIAAGKGSGALFVRGRIVRRVKEKDFVKAILLELARD